jgi:hypothetical protein
MSDLTKQTQKVGDRSVAVVATGDVSVTMGATSSEVAQIVSEVFAKNFLVLRQEAAEVATQRAAELIDRFLSELQERNPVGLAQATSVDFQVAIFNAQREYARSGDDHLADVLVDLLVERSKVSTRELMQLVLNQALETVPLLTPPQLEALGLIFVLRHTLNSRVKDLKTLGSYFDSHIWPLSEHLSLSDTSILHMAYARCGASSIAHATIPSLMLNGYKGLFQKGIYRESVELQSRSNAFASLLIPCLHDSSKFQVGATNEAVLNEAIADRELNSQEAVDIRQLWGANVMSEQEVASFLMSLRPYMKGVMELWDHTTMKNFSLTSVGMAIGHATLRRRGLEHGPLDVWIQSESPLVSG